MTKAVDLLHNFVWALFYFRHFSPSLGALLYHLPHKDVALGTLLVYKATLLAKKTEVSRKGTFDLLLSSFQGGLLYLILLAYNMRPLGNLRPRYFRVRALVLAELDGVPLLVAHGVPLLADKGHNIPQAPSGIHPLDVGLPALNVEDKRTHPPRLLGRHEVGIRKQRLLH